MRVYCSSARFVFADLHVVGLDADLVEQAAEEHRFDTDAREHELAAFKQADVAGGGRHGVKRRIVAVGVNEDRLAGLDDRGQCVADFLGLRQADAGVAEEDQHAFDLRIGTDLFEPF